VSTYIFYKLNSK